MTYAIRGHLHGLQRGWFRMYSNAISIMEDLKNRRSEGNWGILVSDDKYALYYQIAKYRKERAKMSLMGSGCLTSWPAENDEDAKKKGAETWNLVFHKARERYRKAKKRLKNKEEL